MRETPPLEGVSSDPASEPPPNEEIGRLVNAVRGVYEHNVRDLERRIGEALLEDLKWFSGALRKLDDRDRRAAVYLVVERTASLLAKLTLAFEALPKRSE